MPRIGLFLLAALFLLTFGACSDDGTSPPGETTGTVAGIVTRSDDDQPLLETTVALLTDEFVVLGAMKVDPDGAFSFEDIPAGSLLLYAINEDYEMAEPSTSQVDLKGGRTWTVNLRMMTYGAPNRPYHIKGRVTDATTGAPLAGVWLAPTSLAESGNTVRYLMNNSGVTLAVSDEEGLYSLAIYPARVGPDSPVLGLSPISCGRDGYRSRTFAGEGPDASFEPWAPGGLLPAPADSVLILDIALEPIPDGGLQPGAVGTVQGVLTHDGQPQSGVMVMMTLIALAERDTVFDPVAKVAFHESSVRSGDDGSFEFKVEPGFYALRAGLLPDDGWCRDNGPPNLEVVSGEVIDVGNVSLGSAITPISPTPGTKVTSVPIHLSWTPIIGAEFYTVTASFNSFNSYSIFDIGTTTEPELLWELPEPPAGETYIVRWKVYATHTVQEDFKERFSWFEVPATFTLSGEKSP